MGRSSSASEENRHSKKKRRKKRKHFQYPEEDLLNALEDIRENGISVRGACRKYEVPKTTLLDRLAGRRPDYLSKPGRGPCLTSGGEEQLSDWLKQLTKNGFAIRKEVVINAASAMGADLDEELFRDGVPSQTWYTGFLRRHPNIFIGVKRTLAVVNEADIKKWFSKIEKFLENNNLVDVFGDPRRMFICHESEFYFCPVTKNVSGTKGYRTHVKDEDTITILMMFNADGDISPSVAFFPYTKPPREITENLPDGWFVGKSDTGLITSESFFKYIKHDFNTWALENNIPRPLIIFIDRDSTHLSFTLSEWCEENQIVLYALPPNTTSMMRPGDLKVFKLKKTDWKRAVNRWQRKVDNLEASVTDTNICVIFDEMLRTREFETNIKNTFRTSGLFPLDRDAVDYSKCPKKGATQPDECELGQNDLESARRVISSLQDNLLQKGIDAEVILGEIDVLERRVKNLKRRRDEGDGDNHNDDDNSEEQRKRRRKSSTGGDGDHSKDAEDEDEDDIDNDNTIPMAMTLVDKEMEVSRSDTAYDIPMNITLMQGIRDATEKEKKKKKTST